MVQRRSRGCLVLAAFSLVVVLAGCMLGIFGVRSGVVAPLSASGRMGPVRLIAFVLCTSTRPSNPCATGTRSYEVWLLVDWRRLGVGRLRSYPLLNMPLQE
ncbi:MAG TPA: hypothetical protein VFO07_20710 [Roseiflexaceae bacterium]|nr:hypothetical protein [Roseiflexaceae bacterium]